MHEYLRESKLSRIYNLNYFRLKNSVFCNRKLCIGSAQIFKMADTVDVSGVYEVPTNSSEISGKRKLFSILLPFKQKYLQKNIYKYLTKDT